MPRNFMSHSERTIWDIAHGRGSDREKAKAIRKLADSDSRVRKALNRGARASGMGLTFDSGVLSAADKAYKGRTQEEARLRREAQPKEKTQAEIAAEQTKAAHDAAVRKTADERSALNLSEEKFYARFIKPLVEDVSQQMAGDDADAKAAYISGVERYALKATQGKLGTAIHFSQSMGDAKLKSEIAYYIGRHKDNLLQSRLILDVIEPAVTRAAERAVQEGLCEDVATAKGVIPHYPFRSGMSHDDLAEANRSERRFGSYRHSITHLVKQADYRGYVSDVAGVVTKDTDAFEAKLLAGLKTRHEYVSMAEKVQTFVREELQTVVEQGHFPASEKAQQAALRMLAVADAGNAFTAADNIRGTKINVYGTITVNEAGLAIVRDALADPETTRTAARTQFEAQGAKIMQVASLAQAFVAADARRLEGLEQQASLTSQIAETQAQIKNSNLGGLERLKSVYDLFGLKRESKSVAAQFDGSSEAVSQARKAFDANVQAVATYFSHEETRAPENFAAASRDLRTPVPAP